jgi:hypothetical protein
MSRLGSTRRLLLPLALAIAIGAGVGGWVASLGGSGGTAQPKDDPVVFLRGIVSGIARNDYASVWPTLHPAQQRIATRAAYLRCEGQDPVVGRLESVTLLKALDERIVVAGAGPALVDSKAVTFRLRLFDPTGESSADVTVHAVAVAGRWRWILKPRRFAVYRAGGCPTTPTAPAPSA